MMNNRIPEGWQLYHGEKNPAEDARRVAEFSPILPKWEKGMFVANRWDEFSAEQWKSVIHRAKDLHDPDRETIRILDEIRLFNDGEAFYRLCLCRFCGAEGHPPKFILSIHFFYPPQWYYSDQKVLQSVILPKESFNTETWVYEPIVHKDFGDLRLLLPIAPFDIQQEKERLEHNSMFRELISLNRTEYFADDFENDIRDVVQRKEYKKQDISFEKKLGVSWEQMSDIDVVRSTIQPIIENVEVLWKELITQNTNAKEKDERSVAVLSTTFGEDGFLSSDPVNVFLKNRAVKYDGEIEDVPEEGNTLVSLDDKRKIPLIHSDPEYWQKRWKKEIESFQKSGFPDPLQHSRFGPMLLRLIKMAISEIVPNSNIWIRYHSVLLERNLIISPEKIENIEQKGGLTKIIGQLMSSNTNRPLLQNSHHGEFFIVPIVNGVETTWDCIKSIAEEGQQVKISMEICTNEYANHDVGKAFAKLAYYYHALTNE